MGCGKDTIDFTSVNGCANGVPYIKHTFVRYGVGDIPNFQYDIWEDEAGARTDVMPVGWQAAPCQLTSTGKDYEPIVVCDTSTGEPVVVQYVFDDNGVLSFLPFNLDGTPFVGTYGKCPNKNYGITSKQWFCINNTTSASREDIIDFDANTTVGILWRDIDGTIIPAPAIGTFTVGECKLIQDEVIGSGYGCITNNQPTNNITQNVDNSVSKWSLSWITGTSWSFSTSYVSGSLNLPDILNDWWINGTGDFTFSANASDCNGGSQGAVSFTLVRSEVDPLSIIYNVSSDWQFNSINGVPATYTNNSPACVGFSQLDWDGTAWVSVTTDAAPVTNCNITQQILTWDVVGGILSAKPSATQTTFQYDSGTIAQQAINLQIVQWCAGNPTKRWMFEDIPGLPLWLTTNTIISASALTATTFEVTVETSGTSIQGSVTTDCCTTDVLATGLDDTLNKTLVQSVYDGISIGDPQPASNINFTLFELTENCIVNTTTKVQWVKYRTAIGEIYDKYFELNSSNTPLVEVPFDVLTQTFNLNCESADVAYNNVKQQEATFGNNITIPANTVHSISYKVLEGNVDITIGLDTLTYVKGEADMEEADELIQQEYVFTPQIGGRVKIKIVT